MTRPQRHVGDVQQAVDAAEVDEGAVLGEVLDDALDDLAFLQLLERHLLQLGALLLEEHAARQHDVAALLVELDDLELGALADERVEVAHRAQVDLRAGRNAFTPPRMVTDRPPFTRALMVPSISSSRSHAPEISSQTLRRSAFSFESTHRPSSFSRLSRKTSISSPSLTPTDAVGLRELVERDRSFGLVADVDDDVVLADVDHAAFDDVAFFDVLVLEGLFEQCREALLLVVVLGCHRNHAVFLCLSTLAFDVDSVEVRASCLCPAPRAGVRVVTTRSPDHSGAREGCGN